MNLTKQESLFLCGTAIIVAGAVVYFKYYTPPAKCTQNFSGFSHDYNYNPNVTVLGTSFPDSAQTYPKMEYMATSSYMTTPRLVTKGENIPYQEAMIPAHPMTLSREQLEDMVALDGFGVGPGMVEGYRFRGNLNL